MVRKNMLRFFGVFLCLSILVLLSFSTVFATIVGITTTTDNGVKRVTADQYVAANGLISQETVVITGSGRLRGDIDVVQSQLKFYNVGTGNDATAPFTNGARGEVGLQTRLMNASSLTFETTAARHNIFISEMSGGSEVIETGILRALFVYSQPDAIITNAIFRNIKVHEVYRAFGEFFDVSYIDTQIGQLDWEAGRLDRYGINIPSTTSGWYSWLGGGNGGNNAFWDWNPKSIDATKIVHSNVNNRYYQGYTASYKFINKFTSAPVSSVLAIYSDDRTGIGGALVERGRYVTDASGEFTGTIDSSDLSVVALQSLPTLYVLTKQSRQIGGTVATGLADPANSNNYVIDDITSQLEIKSYLHLENPSTLVMSKEVGSIASDLSVEEFFEYLLTPDSGITETNMATVLAYPELDDLEKFYDRSKAEWRTNDGYPVFSVSGKVIDLGGVNLVVNTTGASVYTYASGTNTVTIKTSQFMTTSKLNKIVTTGVINIDPTVLSDLDTSSIIPVNITITGLPIVAGSNALCKFTDISDSTSSVENAVAGEIVFSTVSGKGFQVVCDAIGYERSPIMTISSGTLGATQGVSLSLLKDKDGFNLYGFGAPAQKALITYDDSTTTIYEAYSVAEPIITYNSFVDRLEEIFSSSAGLDYNIEYEFIDGKIKIDSGSSLRLSPHLANTGDPENNFVTFIENDVNPNAPYLTIGPRKIIYPVIDTLSEFDEGGNYTLILDEVKVLNIPLSDVDVKKLYIDSLYYIKLDTVVNDFNRTAGTLDMDVTFPFIAANLPMTYHFYYAEK